MSLAALLWSVVTLIFSVGEEFENIVAMLTVAGTHNQNQLINEPAWTVFTSLTLGHLKVCMGVDGVIISYVRSAPFPDNRLDVSLALASQLLLPPTSSRPQS